MLQVKNLNAFYGDKQVLHDFTLKAKKGQITILLGKSKTGKSTAVYSIMGVHTAKNGKIIFDNHEISEKASHEVSQSGIGLVPQGKRIFPNLTVKENLMMTFRPVKNGWTLEKVYSLFPQLKERESLIGTMLNSDEQQMLSIGRALLTNPKLLLLDEPFEGLTPQSVNDLIKKINILKEKGLTIVLVEQKLTIGHEVADEINIIEEGKLVFSGTKADFLSSNQKYGTVNHFV